MNQQSPFKWRHFEAEIILLCVRWYLRYSLSSRDLEELMREHGLQVDHTTSYRWVQRYAPQLEKRCRPHLKAPNDSWRVDETSVKVRKTWMYLYRAVDSEGNTPSVSLERDAGCRGRQTLLRQSAARHGVFSCSSASDRGTGGPTHCCDCPQHHARLLPASTMSRKTRPTPRPRLSSKPAECFPSRLN